MDDMVSLTAASVSPTGFQLPVNICSLPETSAKIKFGEQSFNHAVSPAWNTLPSFIQSDHNTNSFKKQLKTLMFKSA